MTFTFEKTEKIKDLIIFKPEIYYDFRGHNVETYNSEYLSVIKQELALDINFVTDSHSFSRKKVLRGFHSDELTWKLVQCLHGDVYSVVMDSRKDSPTYLKYFTISLNDRSRVQILIPPLCLNAYLCMSDFCLYSYKLSHSYVEPENQITRKWNEFNIFWPIFNPITSERDKAVKLQITYD